MSATAQTNGKKSSNSSTVNTPSSTPVANGNSQTISQSTPPPPNNNAPKYGTLVPNRIFVGGISANTTEGELLQLFSSYGAVKAAKIIQDRAGVSRGYGFITFESEDDAKRPLKDADNIVLRERKLNIAPAIKKQPFNRAFDASSPSTVTPNSAAQYFFSHSGGVPYFQGGVTYYQPPTTAPGDPNSQPATVYQAPPVYPAQSGPPQAATYPSMMFPPPIYMQQQYPMPPMPYDFNYYPNNGGAQYMVGGQNGPNGGNGGTSQTPSMPASSTPPRPPCYNAQLPYNPDPNLYYNVPVYGPPIDGGVYPETLELANGCYSEVSQIIGEFLPGFEGGPGHYPLADPGQDVDLEHPMAPPPPLLPPPPSHEHETNEPDTTRQSKTPVVSILSIDQHQEKDFVSMQGGRRVKTLSVQPPPMPKPQMVMTHYPPPIHHHHQQQPPYFNNYNNFNGPPVRSQIPYKTVNHNNNNNNRDAFNNGYRKTRSFNNSRKSYDYTRTNDNSSRSSVRTDSNSSANAAVDEIKNEEKVSQVNYLTPPPPPPPSMVHPMHHPHNFQFYNGGTRTYQNSLGRRNPNVKSTPPPSQSQQPPPPAPITSSAIDNNNRNKNNFNQSAQVRNNGPPPPYGPLKRHKRPTRRNGQPGGSLGEIGAGDAPLPNNNNDVSDTCKKLETLKM